MGMGLLLAAALAVVVPAAVVGGVAATAVAGSGDESPPSVDAGTDALLEPPLSVTELTRRATVVLIGEVTTTVTTWNATRDQVTTRVEVRADEVLKGLVRFGTVTVEYPGGTVGSVTRPVAGAPVFARGERVVLFLAPREDGALGVVGGFQGKFALSRDESGREVAARGVPGSADLLDRVFLGDVRATVVATRTP
jgi:hypothetical protein